MLRRAAPRTSKPSKIIRDRRLFVFAGMGFFFFVLFFVFLGFLLWLVLSRPDPGSAAPGRTKAERHGVWFDGWPHRSSGVSPERRRRREWIDHFPVDSERI